MSEIVLTGQSQLAVYILLGVVVVFIVTTIILLVKTIKLEKKYNAFMKGSDGETLEDTILTRFKEIDRMKKEEKLTSDKLDIACETLVGAYQKMGLVKYDAFEEQGGKLSFSLCLLNDKDNGFLMTSIYTRDGCNSFIKEIIRGESYVILSDEERKALAYAKKGDDYSDPDKK